MNIRKLWSPIVLVATLAVLAGATHVKAAEGSFDRTLKVSGPVDLEVTTGSGNIDVRSGDATSVHVHARIKANSNWRDHTSAEEKVQRLESNPPIEQDGNTIRIGHIEDPELRRNISISYDVVAPAQTQLRCESGSGTVSVDGVHGPAKASTGSGSLSIANIGDEVRANTGSGDVRLESIKGTVHATTGSGWIHATGIAGGFTASSGSGGVELEQTEPGHVEVGTGSGNIEVRGVHGPLRAHTGSGYIKAQGDLAGDWSLQTGSGGVDVRLPSDSAFDLYAHSSSGHVTVDHPITIQGTIGRSEIRGKVRGGGFLLEVRTGSGNIEVQ